MVLKKRGMKMSWIMGWKYKTGERVQVGDRVLVSARWAKEHAEGNREAVVTDDHGFVRVQFVFNAVQIDLDMRSLTFSSRSN
jgi:hypothetical protein